uniref:Putative ovule protein n=1 Tax=Solanum chacoense TaxID=4108 RepID=A0A0V0IAA2_SOLCH
MKAPNPPFSFESSPLASCETGVQVEADKRRLEIKFCRSQKAQKGLIYMLYTSIYSQKISHTGQKREKYRWKTQNTELRQNYRSKSSRISSIYGVCTKCIFGAYHDQ